MKMSDRHEVEVSVDWTVKIEYRAKIVSAKTIYI